MLCEIFAHYMHIYIYVVHAGTYAAQSLYTQGGSKEWDVVLLQAPSRGWSLDGRLWWTTVSDGR